jgi:excisionase family DNA binding protein
MGQQIAQAMGSAQAVPSAAPPGAAPPVIAGGIHPAAAPAPGAIELLTPANAALVLNVSETDVLSALADGSLKGKKIGTSWRITRAALDDFLKS